MDKVMEKVESRFALRLCGRACEGAAGSFQCRQQAAARSTEDVKINSETACLLSVTDASHAAEVHVSEIGRPMGHRSQAGRFLMVAEDMSDENLRSDAMCMCWNGVRIASSLPFDATGRNFELGED